MKEWITGRNPVYECLRANRRHFFSLLVQRGIKGKGRVGEVVNLACKVKIDIKEVDKHILSNISENHQGLALQASGYPYSDLSTVVGAAQQSKQPLFILAMDQIQDIQNLGTLIRSAEIFGVHGITIPSRRAAGITPAVVNASSGASEHMLVVQMNISQAIDELKEKEAWVVGLDMDASAKALKELDLQGPLVIVVGSEGHGLRRLVRDKCDYLAKIPMSGRVASLNAAVAGSIALYEAAKQRT